MQADKLPKPSGVCSVCSALSMERRAINNRCSGTFSGRRCSGTLKSATGKVGSQACSACLAFGWRMYA